VLIISTSIPKSGRHTTVDYTSSAHIFFRFFSTNTQRVLPKRSLRLIKKKLRMNNACIQMKNIVYTNIHIYIILYINMYFLFTFEGLFQDKNCLQKVTIHRVSSFIGIHRFSFVFTNDIFFSTMLVCKPPLKTVYPILNIEV